MVSIRTVRAGVLGNWIAVGLCLLAPAEVLRAAGTTQAKVDGLWDVQRYIKVDEIQPGMEGYCLTDYGNAGVEKFGVKVVNVVHNFEPGRNVILVMGTDDRFVHTGIVAGCSGSPVYIDGRLAGALALGWTFAKDPLYGVTPIEDMLQVGLACGAATSNAPTHTAAFTFDFSKPIDLAAVNEQMTTQKLPGTGKSTGATALPCPLLVSGLPAEACRQITGQLEALGFAAVPGLSGNEPVPEGKASLVPGATVTIPLVSGDIRMEVLGTITEVRGDRIYGFGHSFLGCGPTNLPMAGGKVYTVISSVMRSFKLGTCSDIVGAITADESGAIFGRVGAKPDTVPLTIHVNHFNALENHTYNCQVAYNPMLTATLVRSAMEGAAFQVGTFPLDHCIEYSAAIDLDDGQCIRFGNTSSNMELAEPSMEVGGALALLMNNPFRGAAVKDLQFDLKVKPKNIAGYIWSVDIADSKVKPGEKIEAEVVIESFLKEKRKYQVSFDVPENLPAGKYNLMFLGVYEYENFLRKTMPFRFLATNYQTLVEALNATLNVDRTKLYCLLLLPPGGIALEKAELPDLPGTKVLVLQNEKRPVAALPYAHWIERTIDTGTVVTDKEMVPITVEKK
jgi:hypothetical protein